MSSTIEADLATLGEAMQVFFQTMKRPQHWAATAARAGVNIDRPAALILHTLMLHAGTPCRVQDLANQLGIEAPSVTRKTQELELAGYIQRSRNHTDRRVIGLRLTARGRAVGQRLWRAQRAGITEVLTHWPAAERRQFVDLFSRFSQDIANYYETITKQETTPHVRSSR